MQTRGTTGTCVAVSDHGTEFSHVQRRRREAQLLRKHPLRVREFARHGRVVEEIVCALPDAIAL